MPNGKDDRSVKLFDRCRQIIIQSEFLCRNGLFGGGYGFKFAVPNNNKELFRVK